MAEVRRPIEAEIRRPIDNEIRQPVDVTIRRPVDYVAAVRRMSWGAALAGVVMRCDTVGAESARGGHRREHDRPADWGYATGRDVWHGSGTLVDSVLVHGALAGWMGGWTSGWHAASPGCHPPWRAHLGLHDAAAVLPPHHGHRKPYWRWLQDPRSAPFRLRERGGCSRIDLDVPRDSIQRELATSLRQTGAPSNLKRCGRRHARQQTNLAQTTRT